MKRKKQRIYNDEIGDLGKKCVPFASRELVITISWSRVHQLNRTQHCLCWQVSCLVRLDWRRHDASCECRWSNSSPYTGEWACRAAGLPCDSSGLQTTWNVVVVVHRQQVGEWREWKKGKAREGKKKGKKGRVEDGGKGQRREWQEKWMDGKGRGER